MHRILFFLLCTAQIAAAQTFFPNPGPVLEQVVTLQQADEVYIFFDNPSGDSLQLRWRKLEVNVPSGWDMDLCDYGHCYGGIPNNATMNPVHDTIQAYLKLIVQPGMTEGAAWLWFRVYDITDDNNYQDVYFNLHTQGVSSVQDEPAGAFRLYPNPASDLLVLENNGSSALRFEILDASGRSLRASDLQAGAQQFVPVADWPAGMYALRAGRTIRKFVIRH